MPVEIRELHIKAVVQDVAPRTETTDAAVDPVTRLDDIVSACVEQVLDILKQKEER